MWSTFLRLGGGEEVGANDSPPEPVAESPVLRDRAFSILLRDGEPSPILPAMEELTSDEGRVLDALDHDGLLDSICGLIAIPSLGGHETPAQEWVSELMLRIGFDVDVWDLDFEALAEHPAHAVECERDRGLGVVGRLGEEAGGASLILNGHVDVVPPGHEERWSGPPFVPWVADDRIYGRGSVDMKAGLCSAIFAAKAIQDAGVKLAGSPC